MKCTIPEISWHNRDPVLSIDVQPKSPENSKGEVFWRLATGGADSHVLIWHLTISESGKVSIACVADLERHQKAVNVVRFSPSGEILATGDDGKSTRFFIDETNNGREKNGGGHFSVAEDNFFKSAIILWKQKDDFHLPPLPGEENLNKEQWNSWKVLRGHLEDIYDVAWSPDSSFLVSGSVDNSAIVWDVQKGRNVSILGDYKGFVQGVSWDPCNQYICTLSTDRQCRLIDVNTMKTVQRVHKAKIPTPTGHPLEGKTVRLFHDDTFKSFFRRLTFSIDGSLVIAPSGIIEPEESTERTANATIIFSTHNLKEPIMILPSLDESTIAVRCCPIYFELREDGPVSVLALPYRMIFAVATQRSVMIYDTQQISPIAVVSNIHYTRLTDVAWSSDGRILVISSTDGYCSIVQFQEGELGKVLDTSNGVSLNRLSNREPEKSIAEDETEKNCRKPRDVPAESDDAMDIDITRRAPPRSFDEEQAEASVKKESALGESHRGVSLETEDSQDIKLVYNEATTNDDADSRARNVKSTPPKMDPRPVLQAKTPRRVQLITISSPKRAKND